MLRHNIPADTLDDADLKLGLALSSLWQRAKEQWMKQKGISLLMMMTAKRCPYTSKFC